MRFNLFALLICVASGTAVAQTNDTTARIDKLFSSWNNSTPGGSILVARGEKILYQKAFGLANLESNVPNTTATIFEAGSVSKQFVAYSILLLNAEGKLALTDDVRKYVPELPVYEAPVTIQQCLKSHQWIKRLGKCWRVDRVAPRLERLYARPCSSHHEQTEVDQLQTRK